MGLEEGIGMGRMEHEERRGRADNSPAAATLQPSLRTPGPPGLPMEGQRTAGKGPEGDGTHFLKPEGPEEGAHPPHPYEAPTTMKTQEEEERFPDGLPFGKEEPAGEPQKGSQPQDTEWKPQVYQDQQKKHNKEAQQELTTPIAVGGKEDTAPLLQK